MSDTTPGRLSVTAIVVNFETGDLLVRCVRSLEAAGADEIVVVDNASGDDSLAKLQAAGTSARVISAGTNRGYGAGANLGAGGVLSDVLLICNSDVVAEPDFLGPLRDALASMDEVALVGPRILTSDGEVYPSARTFPSLAESAGHAFIGLFSEQNKWTRSYKHRVGPGAGSNTGRAGETASAPGALARTGDDRSRQPGDATVPEEFDWVSGACAAVRREAFAAVGGFDERYFMYSEDVDLCWRLRRAGWRVVYEPWSTITHVQGVSTRRYPYRMLVAHHESMWRFARKTATGKRRLALPAVALGLAARLALVCAKQAITSRTSPGERPA